MKIPLELVDLPVRDLRASVDEDSLDELAASLRDHGQKQAISVWAKPDGRYEVIFGSRRTRAAKLNHWSEIEATIDEEPDETKRAASKLIENVQRLDMTPIEEAYGLLDLIGDGLADVRELQRQTGKSRDWIKTRLALAAMPADLQGAVQAGALSLGVALAFAPIENEIVREQYIKSAIDNGCNVQQAQIWASQAPYAAAGVMAMDEIRQMGDPPTSEPRQFDVTYRCFICGTDHSWKRINTHVVCGTCQDAVIGARMDPGPITLPTAIDTIPEVG